jgi:3-hydroxyisobutyrate dehydrogenase-like beta-hydroxyacid dehydrogenase
VHKVGFVGLGNMGEGMALNLARAGFQLTVRDLRPEPVARLIAAGAAAASSNFLLGQACEIVSIAVFDEAQVRSTCLPVGEDLGLLAGLPAESIVCIHSTIPTSLSRELAEIAAPRGIHILDVPMTGGGEVAAREGALTFFAGGEASAFERCRPVLQAMARNAFHMGALGAGAAAKIMSNFLAISNTIVVREGLRLGRGFGIAEERLLEIVNSGGVGASWVSNNWQRIREQESHYTTGKAGMVAMASKDLYLAQVLARETNTRMPVLDFLIREALPDLKDNSLTR